MFEGSSFFTNSIFISFLALFSGTCMATGAYFVKRKNAHTGIVTAMNGYYILTGLLFIPFVEVPPFIAFVYMVLAGLVYIAGIYARFIAYRQTDLSVVYPTFQALTVLFTALFGFVVLKESLNLYQAVALVLIVSGIYALYQSSKPKGVALPPGFARSFIFIVLAALGLAFYIGIEALGSRSTLNPLNYIPYAMIFSAIPPVINGLTVDRKNTISFLRENWLWCLWPYTFNALSYAASLYVIFYAELASFAIYEKAGIVASSFLGAILLKEKLSPARILGTGLVVLGLVVISLRF